MPLGLIDFGIYKLKLVQHYSIIAPCVFLFSASNALYAIGRAFELHRGYRYPCWMAEIFGLGSAAFLGQVTVYLKSSAPQAINLAYSRICA